MTKDERKFYTRTLKTSAMLALLILSCKFTFGLTGILLAAFGFWAAMQNKLGYAISCYLIFPFLVVANPALVPKGGLMALVLRLGPMMITAALILSGTRRAGSHVIPLGGMTLYMLVAIISSVGGYAPIISFLKIINFLILLFGLWLGFKNIDGRLEEVIRAREMLLALSVIIIGGSVVLLAFPNIGYVNTARQIIRDNPGITPEEVAYLVQQYSGTRLFGGVTDQSQCLAILAPTTIAWVACDMLFVERKLNKLHLALILGGLPLTYLTRSRSSLFSTFVAMTVIYFFAVNRAAISPQVKSACRRGMTGFLMVVVIVGTCLEINDHTFTRWLRKTNNVEGDQRTFGEALSTSRSGLVAESMRDFRENPLLGKGFQVSYGMQFRSRQFVLSAPIEKGVLPVMVLGETGVLGIVAFLVFLATFYGACFRKKYVVTATLFTIILAANMGEANFFSPGGPGGILWTICVGGGFLIDTIVLVRRRRERHWVGFRS